jgi:hypothetical protein
MVLCDLYAECGATAGNGRSLTRRRRSDVGQTEGPDGQPRRSSLALLMHTTLEQAFRDIMSWPGQLPTCVLISIHRTNPEFVSARFEAVGAIRSVNSDSDDGVPSYWVPILANAIETNLNRQAAATEERVISELPGAQSAPATADSSADRQTSESQEADESELIKHSVDVPDFDASIADGRLSIVMSGKHVMFRGRTISPAERFCLE